MRVPPGVILPAAALAVGGALFATRSVLDLVPGDSHPVRIAILPPWQALAAFTLVGGLLLAGLHQLARPRGTTSRAARPRVSSLVLPVFGLLILLLPYLPILPDRWPVLQATGGPAALLVWLAVAAQLVWVLFQEGRLRARWFDGWPLGRLTLGLGFLAALVPLAAAARLEDVAALATPAIEGSWWDELLGPIAAMGSPRLVSVVMAAAAATASAVMWRALAVTFGHVAAATFGVAAVALSAPFLLGTLTRAPEIAAATGTALAFGLTAPLPGSLAPWAVAGAAAAALPWLGAAHLPLALLLAGLCLLRLWQAGGETSPADRGLGRAIAILAPLLVSLGAWITFFSPRTAPAPDTPGAIAPGVTGLLIDQEHGLLLYAPVFVLAVTGGWAAWREGGRVRRLALEALGLAAAVLGLAAVTPLAWTGVATPARPVLAILPLLAVPVAAAFRAAGGAPARRAAQHLLLWLGIGVSALIVVAPAGVLVAEAPDGTSRLLEHLWPAAALWTLAPSLARDGAALAWTHALVWLALAAAAGLWLARRPAGLAPASASVAAMSALAVALVVGAVVTPRLPHRAPARDVNLHARARLPILDAFDTTARPSALVFDPWRLVDAASLEPRLVLGVTPGIRRDRQPVPVLHNGRFSVPAGRYRVHVRWADRPARGPRTMALQVGRSGAPLAEWSVVPTPGGEWAAEFEVPLDAAFVGLRGDDELEASVQAITLVPLMVVDRFSRPRRPVVVGAAAYGDVQVFVHEETSHTEPDGLWLPGDRQSELTLAWPPGEREMPLTLRVHSGPRPNHVVLESRGWRRELALEPATPETVALPADARGLLPLTVTAGPGFVPSELDPASTDHRRLGAWLEIVR